MRKVWVVLGVALMAETIEAVVFRMVWDALLRRIAIKEEGEAADGAFWDWLEVVFGGILVGFAD